MRTVASFQDPHAAHIARGKLESEGIDAHVQDDHVVGMNWLYSTAVGGAKVVDDDDYDRARSVVALDENLRASAHPSS